MRTKTKEKYSPIGDLKRLRKELNEIDQNIKTLAGPGPAVEPEPPMPLDEDVRPPPQSAPTPRQEREEQVVRERAKRIRDDRFASYFAGSFEGMRPLRHERRIQRNKAILMIVFVLLVLFWVAYRFFL